MTAFLKSFFVLLTWILIVILSSGCVVEIGGREVVFDEQRHGGSVLPDYGPKEVAHHNRQKIGSLKLGMSPVEVVSVMGEGTFGGDPEGLSNPHTSSAVALGDGTVIEVLYFYTENMEQDGRVTADELTPVFFEDGELVGWGTVGLEALLTERGGSEVEAIDPGEPEIAAAES